MRKFAIPLTITAALTLAACKQEDARPAKEAVAQAKGAAADAKDAAREAAASVRETVHDTTEGAEAAAAQARVQADQAVTGAARAVQDGMATAAQSTRTGAANVAQGVRELGEGGVVTGRVTSASTTRLALQPEKTGPAELHLDSRTRYLLRGTALQKGGLPSGTRVRATYVVEASVPTATEVEVVAN
jgi:hypothetical protein